MRVEIRVRLSGKARTRAEPLLNRAVSAVARPVKRKRLVVEAEIEVQRVVR